MLSPPYFGDSHREEMTLRCFENTLGVKDQEVQEVYFKMRELIIRLAELRRKCPHVNRRDDTRDEAVFADMEANKESWPNKTIEGVEEEFIRTKPHLFSCPDCGRIWRERPAILVAELNHPAPRMLFRSEIEDGT